MGLALLTKSFPALIVLPIFLILTIKPKEWLKNVGHCLLISTVALAVYLPWQMYIFNVFPQEAIWENNYNIRHLTEALEGHAGNAFWQLVYAAKIWNELIYIVFLWFVVFVSKRLKDRKLLSLIVWITMPYLFFSLVATKMIAYPLFTAPAIFTIEALFCWQLLDKPIKPLWFSKLLVITLIILAARYAYERVKPFDPQTGDRETAAMIKTWTPIFSKNKQTIVFNADAYIECMFYHNNCTAYPYLPKNKDIEYLNKLEYTIYIVKNSKIDSVNFAPSVQFLTF
jgi:4-amino-4-deoxy-L-arabinose transferase-like glycosyltransferase